MKIINENFPYSNFVKRSFPGKEFFGIELPEEVVQMKLSQSKIYLLGKISGKAINEWGKSASILNNTVAVPNLMIFLALWLAQTSEEEAEKDFESLVNMACSYLLGFMVSKEVMEMEIE
jgi:hypothetical protein